jgi:pimeloyl-ACP methyl ester carboxylesterase
MLLLAPAGDSVLAQDPRKVDVDGRQIRVRVGGLERSGTVPAVVLEAGARDVIESWDAVFTSIAAFAPVVAYDRVGNGLSEPDGQLPTPMRVAQTLRTLLTRVSLEPPYVLVGHSWGGPLIRTFAGVYPGDVAGLVHVDPTDMRTEEQDEAYFRAQGFAADARERRRAEFQEGARRLGGEMQVIAEADRTFFAEIRALPVPDVHVAVLMSARYDPSVWANRPCAPQECHDVWIRLRTEWLTAWVRQNRQGTFTLVANSGHYIQREDPALVVSVVRRIVEAAR